jgi:hypothetical protein
MYTLPGALAPLASYAQFIVVEFVPDADRPGKTLKYPINPNTGMRHDAHDSSIWMRVGDAGNGAERMGGAPRYGVGFVITAADPFICLDMDNCATPSGWSIDALEMLQLFPGACELSNSGQGLHVWSFYRGVCPPHGKKAKGRLDHKWLELYSELRFIALGTSATGSMQDVTGILPGFIDQWFKQVTVSEAAEWTTAPVPEHTPLSDDNLIARAIDQDRRQAAESIFGDAAPLATFTDFWTRNVAVLARIYPAQMAGKEFDGSDVDFAFAKELAYWTGKNCERIERLMLMSPMVRDKWHTRRKDTTYLRQTILEAVATCTRVYHAKALMPVERVPGAKLVPTVITHQVFIGRDNMAELFEGCVYVQDLNGVLLPTGDIVDQARFKARYAGRMFVLDNNNDKTTKDAWEGFINNSVISFPRVEGTAFEPREEFQAVVERAGRQWVNVYKEPPIERRPGDVTPFMEFIKKLLPNGDDHIILLSFMAAVVQHRGTKFKWAPFIQGTQGNGKSTIVMCLRHALGHKYIFTVKAPMIENGFNSWMENNILYVADDIYTINDRENMMEALKSLITEESQSVTLKGIDSIEKWVCGNFIFTDNHKDAMRKRDESRRVCTLYCAQQSNYDRIRDGLTKQFFAKSFIPWLKAGGFAYVAEMLHTMDIDPRYNPAGECQEAPETSVTAEAIIDGRTGVEHEVDEWITLEEPGFCGDFVSYHMLRSRLEATPRYSKSATPLKIKEMLGRLGYEQHRHLERGRLPFDVQPDGTRPILYVRRDSMMAELTDPSTIATVYAAAQQDAMAAAIKRRFT